MRFYTSTAAGLLFNPVLSAALDTGDLVLQAHYEWSVPAADRRRPFQQPGSVGHCQLKSRVNR